MKYFIISHPNQNSKSQTAAYKFSHLKAPPPPTPKTITPVACIEMNSIYYDVSWNHEA